MSQSKHIDRIDIKTNPIPLLPMKDEPQIERHRHNEIEWLEKYSPCQ